MNSAAVKYHNAREVGSSIGQVLLEQGKLTSLQAEKVLQYQRESGARFGEMAVKLGFVSQMDVDVALSVQFSYPYLPPEHGELSPLLIAASQPSSPAVEALRGLRCQLMLRPPADGKRTLAIIGQDDSASAYLLAANLAIVYAQLGERTLLIDADLRHTPLGALFGIQAGPGLSEMLSLRAGNEVIQPVEALQSLSILTAGVVPPNPQELLARSVFPQLLLALRARYEVIIINTPPLRMLADAQVIATRVDSVLLSADAGVTSIQALERLLLDIRRAGAEVLGCVVSQPVRLGKKSWLAKKAGNVVRAIKAVRVGKFGRGKAARGAKVERGG